MKHRTEISYIRKVGEFGPEVEEMHWLEVEYEIDSTGKAYFDHSPVVATIDWIETREEQRIFHAGLLIKPRREIILDPGEVETLLEEIEQTSEYHLACGREDRI